MKKLVVAVLLIAASVMPAGADYALRGQVKCTDVVKEHGHQHYRQYNVWWLLGYVSARNFAADKAGENGLAGKGVDNAKLYETALKYCRENPDKDWNDAAHHTYGGLK